MCQGGSSSSPTDLVHPRSSISLDRGLREGIDHRSKPSRAWECESPRPVPFFAYHPTHPTLALPDNSIRTNRCHYSPKGRSSVFAFSSSKHHCAKADRHLTLSTKKGRPVQYWSALMFSRKRSISTHRLNTEGVRRPKPISAKSFKSISKSPSISKISSPGSMLCPGAVRA